MARQIDEVVGQVPPIRGLEPTTEVPYRVLDQAGYRAELEALFREEFPPELVAAEDDLYTRLGLLDPDEDLEELMLSLFASQALAFYDPRTGTFTIVGPLDRIGPLEEVVVAHEYGHALQDQRWDLEGTRSTDPSRADEILAQTAFTEGDATAIMYEWAARNLDLVDLLRVAGAALGRQDEGLLRRMPPILRRQLELPYLDGFAFVNALRGRGDWAAVNEAWENRPVSTEQILHPELYPDEVPVPIELPDVAALLGRGWSTSYTQTMGELQISVWLDGGRSGETLLPDLLASLSDAKAEAAAGWGGDRLVSLDGPDGAWVVAWQTEWDSERDASEFAKAATTVMKDRDGASDVLDADIAGGLSSPRLVLVADSGQTLDVLRVALGLES